MGRQRSFCVLSAWYQFSVTRISHYSKTSCSKVCSTHFMGFIIWFFTGKSYQEHGSVVCRSLSFWVLHVVWASKLQPFTLWISFVVRVFLKGPLVWYPCYYILMLPSSEGTRVLPCRELCWFSSVEPIVSTSITSASTLCCILQTWEPMHRHGSGWSNGSTTRTTGSDSRPTPSVTPGESNISVRSTGKSDSAKNRESGQTHTSDIVGRGV